MTVTPDAYPVKTDRFARNGRTPRVREWGWRLVEEDGTVRHYDHGYDTKKDALAAAVAAAEFYYGKEI